MTIFNERIASELNETNSSYKSLQKIYNSVKANEYIE